jgi:hypothetical protein
VGGALTPVVAGPAWRRPVTIGPVAHTYTVPAAVLGNSNGLATVPGLEVWRLTAILAQLGTLRGPELARTARVQDRQVGPEPGM